ncbi:glycosyltransferase family 4 protein [Nonomuraea lactucae]|uniref:glycosyltransferase family 4 protein n=1 Tax=Nonomuraea lactucae TaxID=2249762 RepID=UPI000DE2DFF0|nr:MraY family glycosyltransferase [Nonomuraea lactucae]
MNAAITLAAGVIGGTVSGCAVVPLKRLAVRWDLTDRPGEKKGHARPTPYLGGLAIVLGTVVPVMVLPGVFDIRVVAIVLAATAIALLGLIDDIRPLPALTRLAAEMVAATCVVLSGVQIPVTGGWPDGPFTVVWVVVMTNSFNLLDNMDGALGTVATVTGGFLAATAFVSGQATLALLLAALACACLGYLPHNWAPARIFMGDSGSLFIGFTLTSSAVLLVTGKGLDTALAGLLLPTFVAGVDTGVVLVSRIRAGRSPMTGGTDHVSHRLRRIGLRTRAVAVVLGGLAAVAGGLCLATALQWTSPLVAAALAGVATLLLVARLQGVHIYVPVEHLKAPPRIRERRR